MNNYLSLNLVSGRLSRYAGGSRPSFIVGEQNNTQIYILDFPKPTTYPPDALGDAFAYSIESQDYNSSNLTLKAGVRGGNVIISQSSFSNLPNNINANISISYRDVYHMFSPVIVSGSFSFSSIATQDSLYSISLTNYYSVGGLAPSYTGISPNISFNSSISTIDSVLRTVINQATPQVQVDSGNIFQSSDYSYSFSYTMLNLPNNNGHFLPNSSSISINTSQMKSNYGKYGFLDFTSPQWNTILGNKNEKEIWLEAMINGQTISQGLALINKKMS